MEPEHCNKTSKKSWFWFFVIFMLFPIFTGRNLMADSSFAKIPSATLAQIQKKGKLTAIIDYNSTDYFLYKGNPMGFQYELLQKFAENLGVELNVLSPKKSAESYMYLLNERADLIAGNLPFFLEMQNKISYSLPFLTTGHVVLTSKHAKGNDQVKQLHARYLFALPALRREMENVPVVDASHYSLNELAEMLNEGKIRALALDQSTAHVLQATNKNLKISQTLNDTLNLSWTTRADAHDLQESVNEFMYRFKLTAEYRVLCEKYFKYSNAAKIWRSEYFTTGGGKLSAYDKMIRKESRSIGWDWRLVASLAYEESKFDHNVVSRMGATGIMQIMPVTFAQFKIAPPVTPEENVRVAMKLLKWLDKLFAKNVPNPDERLNFVLAAYNIGFGHIEDARRLAEKYGQNPYRWEDVSYFLLNKSKPDFYRDKVALHGFCRGYVPVNFVENVMKRYEHYCNFVEE
jgi:membrane-bound lytic murein transglycosylase F